MARAGAWWLAAAILTVASDTSCALFRSCKPTSDPDCIGGEMTIVWTGERCTWIHGGGKGGDCWRSIDECNAYHASCPDMVTFPCGDEWCYRTNQICGAFPDGRRRCVPSPTVPPSCDGLGSIAARCATERRGIEVTIARDLPCGNFGRRCAAGLERCQIVARRDWPPDTTCVAKAEGCRVNPLYCRFLGDDYVVKRETYDLGTTFNCGGTHTCRRHDEVCVYSAGRPKHMNDPGRCVREEFPDCLGRGFDHCLTDTFGAAYAFQ